MIIMFNIWNAALDVSKHPAILQRRQMRFVAAANTGTVVKIVKEDLSSIHHIEITEEDLVLLTLQYPDFMDYVYSGWGK